MIPKYSILIALMILSVASVAYLPAIVSSFGRRLFTSATVVTAMASRNLTPYSMAFVTVPNEDLAKKLARGIIEQKLAACVNIIPKLSSVYEWEGKIQEDSELLLMVKTRTSRIEELTSYVKANHTYDVPEVIATSIEEGNQAYLDWIGSVVPEKSVN